MNSAASSVTQSVRQFEVDAFARPTAVGHELTLPPVAQIAPVVFVVDDDVSVRESLELLIRCEGWQPRTFASALEFLDCRRTIGPSCLILDYCLPDLNGLELQKRVAIERPDMPIIFITGRHDVPMTVQAMKAGAFEFLTKPFLDDVLLKAIRDGLDRSRAAVRQQADMQQLRERYASLSCRERQVMALVASGLLNKQVGGELGISEITVKAHRGKVMQKMQADSLADLVRMATRLRIPHAPVFQA
jgi:FixJ family two-component response regulator